jgi:hypothetical protein
MKPNRSSPLLLLRLHSNLLAAFLFLSRTVFSDPGCTRMWQLGLARQLDATRCRCDLFFRSGICDWIPRNVAKRYFAQWYLGAPLVYVYQRPSCFRSLFGLHYDKILDKALVQTIISHPLLSPLPEPPEPWTGVRKGGLPADHWAKVSLVREHHKSIEDTARKAIGTGRMKRLLDSINALQAIPFAINIPVLHFMRGLSAPPVPPPPADNYYAKQRHLQALVLRPNGK